MKLIKYTYKNLLKMFASLKIKLQILSLVSVIVAPAHKTFHTALCNIESPQQAASPRRQQPRTIEIDRDSIKGTRALCKNLSEQLGEEPAEKEQRAANYARRVNDSR